jgi:hypothetical protein
VAAGSGRGRGRAGGRVSLTAADFASARDRVLLGTWRASPLAPGELATVAVHEAGHALVAATALAEFTIAGACSSVPAPARQTPHPAKAGSS